MCPADYFDIEEIHNPHMEGQKGKVNRQAANREYSELKIAFEDIDLKVHELPPTNSLVDQVFTANPSLAGLDRNGRPFALLSRMRHASRQAEVHLHKEFYEELNVPTIDLREDSELSTGQCFEGGGDALWHPNHYLLWIGAGPRSDVQVLKRIADILEINVLVLELVNPAYYHLDTCLCMLDSNSCIYVEEAFNEKGIQLIQTAFQRSLAIDSTEAMSSFAANAFCPDEKHVFLPAGATKLNSSLAAIGFESIELQTNEFKKIRRQYLLHEASALLMNPIKLRKNNYSWAAPIYDRCGQLYSFGAIGASKKATLENCPANSNILLLGCGTAEEAVKAARKGCRLHLVDQSEAMLARARGRFAQESTPPIFSKADIFDWQCDQKFDFIVANYFLNVFSKDDVSKLFLENELLAKR